MSFFYAEKRKEEYDEEIIYSRIREEGNQDKVCDQIADTNLDACLKEDPDAHVACEILATKGALLLTGEISSRYEPDVPHWQR